MNYENINFTDQDQMSGTQFKFESVGDSIKGTYVGKREGVQTQYGETTIFRIMNNDGVWVIFPNAILKDQMDMLALGQIIEVKLTGTKPSKKGNDQKLYTVYSRPSLVNQEWIDQHAITNEASGAEQSDGDYEVDTSDKTAQDIFPDDGQKDGEINVDNMNFNNTEATAPTTAAPAAPATTPEAPKADMTPDQKKAKIAELATTKLGVPAGQDCSMAVMSFTKVAMIEENYNEIIKLLEA